LLLKLKEKLIDIDIGIGKKPKTNFYKLKKQHPNFINMSNISHWHNYKLSRNPPNGRIIKRKGVLVKMCDKYLNVNVRAV